MTIRKKTILTLLGVLLISNVFLGFILSRHIGSGFKQIEEREARRNMERVRQALLNTTETVCSKLTDWAVWDDTYRFMQDGNGEYLESNLVDASFTGMQLNLIMFYNLNGSLKYGIAFDDEVDKMKELPSSLIAEHFGPASPLLRHPTLESVQGGVLISRDDTPLFFCSMPIRTSSGTGPSRGTLVFGAYLNQSRKTALSNLTRLSLTFSADHASDPRFARALGPLTSENEIVLKTVSEDEIAGFIRIPDPSGTRSLVVQAALPREIHQEAKRTLRAALLALAGVGAAFSVTLLLLVEWIVLRRVARLGAGVREITDRFDFARRVDEEGTDELAQLGRSVNGLLAAMEQAVASVDPGGNDQAPQP